MTIHLTPTKQCLSAETLGDYIGERAAAIVVEHYGGQTIKTPIKPAGAIFADLCTKIGEEMAMQFVEVFKGEHIYIALNDRALRESMAMEVMRLRAEGLSFEQIASKYRGPPKRYTPSGLSRLVKRVKAEQS
jgi:hypothetical protein